MFTRLLFLLVFCCSSPSQAVLQCRSLFEVAPSTSEIPTQDEIRQMLKHSRDGSREKVVRKSYRDFFARVLSQPTAAYESLSPKAALEYLSLFAQWRFLPPANWNATFLTILQRHIDTWSSGNYLNFALQRKISPLVFPQIFLQTYLKNLKAQFLQFDATTQLETFSAELYHGHPWTIDELSFFITTLTQSVRNHHGKLQLKPLKETYRGLLFLSESERQQLKHAIEALIEQLDLKLNDYGLSLTDGGKSGSRYGGSTTTDPRYVSLIMDLNMLYPRAKFKHEFSDADKSGFYDPVDLLIVEPRLIVEWDGPHHYFRKILQDGTVLEETSDLVLRPADQARDKILREAGYQILRISPPLAKLLDTLHIQALIVEQNP